MTKKHEYCSNYLTYQFLIGILIFVVVIRDDLGRFASMQRPKDRLRLSKNHAGLIHLFGEQMHWAICESDY
jgi:hypothetical protein